MRIESPGHLPSSVRSSAFLRAGERAELAAARTELLVIAVALVQDGRYGEQVFYWLRSESWPAERVLALDATELRTRQVAEIRARLDGGADAVGPFRLIQRRTSSGRAAWALLDTADDEQLSLDEPGAVSDA